MTRGPAVNADPPDMSGGAERDRTVGLLNAIQALSQLSYSPTICSEEGYPIIHKIASGPGAFLSGIPHFFVRR